VDLNGSRQISMGGFSEHGNKYSGSIKVENFLTSLVNVNVSRKILQ
jgi:hypothetical protein